MTSESTDSITVSLPVAGVLTAAEIEQSAVETLERRVIDTTGAFIDTLVAARDHLIETSDLDTFERMRWTVVVADLHNLAQVCTRTAVQLATSLAARDALIHQNTSRAPESALEREG